MVPMVDGIQADFSNLAEGAHSHLNSQLMMIHQ